MNWATSELEMIRGYIKVKKINYVTRWVWVLKKPHTAVNKNTML